MDKVEFSIADIFRIEVPRENKVVGLSEPVEHTPVHVYQKNYHFRKDLLRDLLAWWKFAPQGEGLFLTGPKGSGKSSLILQVAARLNWPCTHITSHGGMEISDLVGRPILKSDGAMDFQYGPLANALKNGYLFLLNEMDALDASVSVGLNGIIEGEPLVIPENGGEVIHPHPDFRFVATGNTTGNGDEGTYFGASRQNAALMDRFWVVEVGYMEKEAEKVLLDAIVPRKMAQRDTLIDNLLDFAAEIRKQYIEGYIDQTISTRALLRLARMMTIFTSVSKEGKNPFHYSLDRACCNLAESATKTAIHEIGQRFFGE